MSWIEVDYRFTPGVDPHIQARVIAIGQTAGTWSERFAHRDASLRAHLGEVVGVADRVATVRFPFANVEGDVGTLLTMIFGKYSMAGPAKVVGLRVPDGFGVAPRHGLAGIRRLTGVSSGPIVMAIFKPALGLTAADHAALLREVALAGVDIVKDDEILGDLPGCPALDRVRACRPVIDEVALATGKRCLYAVNVTGRAHEVLDRARRLVDAGANALLFNGLTHGWSVLESLAASVDVPVFLHPALAGALAAAPDHGFAWSVLLGTLPGLAGADAVLHPSSVGSLPFSRADEEGVRDALRARGLAPVPSAGVHPGVVPALLDLYGADVVLNAGTGIMDHPSGPAAGVRAMLAAAGRG